MTFKELRISKGYKTVKELAQKLEMPLPRVQKWDGEISAPRIKDLSFIAEILNISVNELLDCFKKEN